MRQPYSIDLDKEEYITLEWLHDRGYTANLLDVVEFFPHENEDGGCELKLTEAQAWEWLSCVEDDREAYLTCCGSQSLIDKLTALEMSIV